MAFADVTFVTLQILTKAGVLNVPAWYAAGKVSAEQSNIDWRESPARPAAQLCKLRRASAVRPLHPCGA